MGLLVVIRRLRPVSTWCLALTSLLAVFSLFNLYVRCSHEQLFNTLYTESDQRSLDSTLQTLIDVLNRINATYFMTSGTLLGSYRHHNTIPWDDDVDIIIRSSDKLSVWKALTALLPDYGLFLSGLINKPYHWKFYPRNSRRRHADGHSIIFKPFRWPFVDLLFYAENATHVWNESPWFSDECWPRHTVFPLKPRPFGQLWLPAPCDTATVLAINFDVQLCVSRSWSHIHDLPMLPGTSVSVPCHTLANRYPFVHRRLANGTSHVVEDLVLGNKTLSSVVLPVGCSITGL